MTRSERCVSNRSAKRAGTKLSKGMSRRGVSEYRIAVFIDWVSLSQKLPNPFLAGDGDVLRLSTITF